MSQKRHLQKSRSIEIYAHITYTLHLFIRHSSYLPLSFHVINVQYDAPAAQHHNGRAAGSRVLQEAKWLNSGCFLKMDSASRITR